MHRAPRKTTPRVKNGRVQRKNYRDLPPRTSGSLLVHVDVPGAGYRHVLSAEHVQRFFTLVPDWPRLCEGLDAVVLAEGSANLEGWYERGVIALCAWPDPTARTVSAAHFAAHRAIWERLGIGWRAAPEFLADVAVSPDAASIVSAAAGLLEAAFEDCEWAIEPGPTDAEWIAYDRSDPNEPLVCDLVWVEGRLHLYERCVFVRFDRRTAAAYQLLHVFLHELGHHVDWTSRTRRGVGTRGEGYAEGWAVRCAEAIWTDYMRELGTA